MHVKHWYDVYSASWRLQSCLRGYHCRIKITALFQKLCVTIFFDQVLLLNHIVAINFSELL